MKLPLAPVSPFWRKVRRNLRRLALAPLRRRLVRPPDTVVSVPSLDDAMRSAIALIAPGFMLPPGEAGRRLWEQDQNNSCRTEDDAAGPILRAMPPPRRILEIGPGLGRSAVYFSRRYFPEAEFTLFDATGHDTKYALIGPRRHDSFCGNLPLLERCLRHNGLTCYRIVDAGSTGGRLPASDGPYDLIYSFFAVGFHWALEDWLDEILALGAPHTLHLMTVANHFRFPERLQKMPRLLLQAHSGLYPLSTTYFCAFVPAPQPWFPAR